MNANRSLEAINLIEKQAMDRRIDMIIITEPNKRKIESGGWFKNKDGDVAVKVLNNDNIRIIVYRYEEESGYLALKTNIGTIIGCYLTPNEDITNYKNKLDSVAMENREMKNIILAGDFNAKSAYWNANKEDERGKILCEWMSERDLVVANGGDGAMEMDQKGRRG
ncbi:uncharacterized protein [Onthophagus taurus]|uniref:uncharacterized protein n=1 Tax=Onthophagus taurus TaxID=166361 RepID=UPI0039BE8C89